MLSLVLHMTLCRFWDSGTKPINMLSIKIFKGKKKKKRTPLLTPQATVGWNFPLGYYGILFFDSKKMIFFFN